MQNEELKEIFFDFAASVVDACFTPDSHGILVVPRHNPTVVVLLRLPILRDDCKKGSVGPSERNPHIPFHGAGKCGKTISFEPRVAGPVCVFGPTVNVFGDPLEITQIESNGYSRDPDDDEEEYEEDEEEEDCGFHFITWNDSGMGDYCLWSVACYDNDFVFHCSPRLIGNVYDQPWLEEDTTPKTFILQAHFQRNNLICLLIQRIGYGRTGLNGIGVQMILLPEPFVDTDMETNPNGTVTLPQVSLERLTEWGKANVFPTPSLANQTTHWFKVADESATPSDILAMKWTSPLMLGSIPSISVIVRGQGLMELVDHSYVSHFLANGELRNFSQDVTNFYQLYSAFRFWVTPTGQLRLVVVSSPRSQSAQGPCQIEWSDFADTTSKSYEPMKSFAGRLGYRIRDLKDGTEAHPPEKIDSRYSLLADPDSDSNQLELVYNKWKKRSQKDPKTNQNAVVVWAAGRVYGYVGMHLYRCWQCQRILLKPLQCSRCKSVVYCR